MTEVRKRTVYPCLKHYRADGSFKPSAWFAKDNAADYGHICNDCYEHMSEANKQTYGKPTETPEPLD